MSSSARFFNTHKRTLLALIFGLAFSGTLAYAVPPATQYTPAETLDPACAPGDTNCSVDISGTGAAWGLITGTLSNQTDLQNALNTKESILTFSTGLTRTSNTIRNNLSTGIAGGQSVVGGTVASDNLTLSSTTNATKGKIVFGTSAYDEANNRLGVGTINPTTVLEIRSQLLTSGESTPFLITDQFGASTPFAVNSVGGSGSNVMAIGKNAGIGSSNVSGVFFGQNAGFSALNVTNTTLIGSGAGQDIHDISQSTFIGEQTGNSTYSITSSFFGGYQVGAQSHDIVDTIFIGNEVGVGASLIDSSNFIGHGAGGGAGTDHITSSNFIGPLAGRRSKNITDSNFIGNAAGYETHAGGANFIGAFAGYKSAASDNSIFIGTNAGRFDASANGSDLANDSIFIGNNAGYKIGDLSLDNSTGGTSILIGEDSSTGGFSNSIALGKDATNTASNQFMIGSSYTQINARGVNYTWPAAQAGGSGYVLSNNGSGVLSWVAGGGGGGPTLQTNNVANGSQSLLNLFAGANVTLTDNGSGRVTIAASGGGGGGGTVTSVALSAPTGFSVTGSPVTGSGTLGLTTSLSGLVYGTGSGFAAATIGAGLDFTGGVLSTTGGGTGTVTSIDISGGGPISFMGGPITTSGTINMNFTGSGGDVVLADGGVLAATLLPNIYNADGTIASNRVVTYGADLSFVDGGTSKTGLSFDTTNFYSTLGDFGSGIYVRVDNTNTRTEIGGNLYIPTGAAAGYVLTSDSSGNASWVSSPVSIAAGSSLFSSGVGAGVGATLAYHSIFLGQNAGVSDTVDNTGSADDFSILLGPNTSTNGNSNSIAIGSGATNTASNQFVIGSTTRPIDSTVFYGTGGTSCTITTGTSMSCSSDERLKTNIADLTTDTLDTLLTIRTVTYNWNATPDGKQMVGFLAQDLQQYFPQLVSTGPGDYLQVNYAGITPILVEAIREMNLKIVDISDLTKDNSWRSALVAWLGNATNGIQSIFSKEVHTDTLCVKKSDGSELCLTGDQLQSAINGQGNTIIMPPPPAPTPDPTPVPDPTPDTLPSTDPVPADDAITSDTATPSTDTTVVPTLTDSSAPTPSTDPIPPSE